MKEIKQLHLKCERCSHKWTPRGNIIIICPKCKSPYWDRKKVNNDGAAKP
jgi:Zn finger protein HypA/HybF involved in hydrogenase expression